MFKRQLSRISKIQHFFICFCIVWFSTGFQSVAKLLQARLQFYCTFTSRHIFISNFIFRLQHFSWCRILYQFSSKISSTSTSKSCLENGCLVSQKSTFGIYIFLYPANLRKFAISIHVAKLLQAQLQFYWTFLNRKICRLFDAPNCISILLQQTTFQLLSNSTTVSPKSSTPKSCLEDGCLASKKSTFGIYFFFYWEFRQVCNQYPYNKARLQFF